jgi:uncharacterized protein YggE
MRENDKHVEPGGSDCPLTIEVFGEGRAAAAPDQAVILLGAVTEGKLLQELQADNSATMQAVIDALLAAGLSEEQLQTVEFRMEPQYDFPDGQQVFRNYRLTHMLQVTTDRIDDAGALIDAAVAAGANQVSSIQFSFADPEAYYNQALSLAVTNAQEKAELIAANLGVRLSAVPCKVQELQSGGGAPVPFGAMLKMAADTSLMPGELTVKAAVRVWYWYQ